MVVKFQLVSDLHIETQFGDPEIREFIEPVAGIDILVLAGDIGRIHDYDKLSKFLHKLSKKFQCILYVLGNQEFYKVRGVLPKEIHELENDLKNMNIPNLIILNRNSVIIEDVCFTGCTLWSDATVDIPHFVNIEKMNNALYKHMYLEDLEYLKTMIDHCEKNKIKHVVITHHAPTYEVIKHKSENYKYRSLYASELRDLMGKNKVHTWAFGHVNKNYDFKLEGTRIVTNQKGKPKDRIEGFSPTKVIQVD